MANKKSTKKPDELQRQRMRSASNKARAIKRALKNTKSEHHIEHLNKQLAFHQNYAAGSSKKSDTPVKK